MAKGKPRSFYQLLQRFPTLPEPASYSLVPRPNKPGEISVEISFHDSRISQEGLGDIAKTKSRAGTFDVACLSGEEIMDGDGYCSWRNLLPRSLAYAEQYHEGVLQVRFFERR